MNVFRDILYTSCSKENRTTVLTEMTMAAVPDMEGGVENVYLLQFLQLTLSVRKLTLYAEIF